MIKVNYVRCPTCGKMIGSTAFTRHLRACKEGRINHDLKEKDEHGKTQKWYDSMHKRKKVNQPHTKINFECKFCKQKFFNKNKEFKTNHENHCVMNSNRKKYIGHKHTEEFKKYISEIAKKYKLGGWHTSRSFDYNDVKLDSSYEVTLAQDLDKNNIKWERPKSLLWKFNGKEHRYYPDFFLPDYNIFVDTKNDYLINNINPRFGIKDVEKIKFVEIQNNVKIFILDKNNLSWKNLLVLLSGR